MLKLKNPDTENSTELNQSLSVLDIKSAFWQGYPVAIRREPTGDRVAANFEPRLPPSAVTCLPAKAALAVGEALPSTGAGREAAEVPFLKGPEGRREAAGCRKENGELPPGRVGAEGWARQQGFPVCWSGSGPAAPGVGRRPLPPGCWLVPAAGVLASPCLRCCSPALGATSSSRAPGGPPPDPLIPAPAALGLRCGQ